VVPLDQARDRLWLSRFSFRAPAYQTDQDLLLAWIADAHAIAAAARNRLTHDDENDLRERIGRVLERVTLGANVIERRGHALRDVGSTDWDRHEIYALRRDPRGASRGERMRVFGSVVNELLSSEYPAAAPPPEELVFVSCTGRVTPSPAQRLVVERGWMTATQVRHAYDLRCHAALPALSMAVGDLLEKTAPANVAARVDVVHAEICSLHFDPTTSSLEQLVMQSLFADGFARYSVSRQPDGPGLRVLALSEVPAPNGDGHDAVIAEVGMQVSLGHRLTDKIEAAGKPLVADLYRRAGRDQAADRGKLLGAFHPGGPRTIDRMRDGLGFTDRQCRHSREVLRDHGNMSSATLPAIWKRIVDDASVPKGTPVLSLAIGPGLGLCGALLVKG
jgi:predicted naringenin-chalcone synthase